MTLNPLSPDSGPATSRCGGCVWHFVGGRGPAVSRCRRHGGARLDPDWPGCSAFTASLDCLSCGACCREAYHAVEVGPRDPFVRAHPDRVVQVDGRLNVRRRHGVCACLDPQSENWPCVVYADRPKTCRDFEAAGPNCVDARVGWGSLPEAAQLPGAKMIG